MPELVELLLDAGLIQFGHFRAGDRFQPVLVNLHLLAAYPDLLRRVAQALAPLTAGCDRLLCPPDSIPLGTAVSLETGIALVYSQGQGGPPVHDLVGAYDVGHPTALIANTPGGARLPKLLRGAKGVGLDVKRVGCVLTAEHTPLDLEVRALLRLEDIAQALAAAGRLPRPQAEAIRVWLRQP